MLTVDLNCDMGEGTGNDAAIMPYISSANIACGYHAGDEKTMWQTMELAAEHKVAVGAHVSFFDRKHFGREEINIPVAAIYDLVTQQLIILQEIADSFGIQLHHVKPHGALYNMAAKKPTLAAGIARAVKDYDEALVLFGLSGSHAVKEAEKAGLRTASEAFADRTYQDNGSLTQRTEPHALINEAEKVVQQVLQMIMKKTVTAFSGKEMPILAETICVHGDGKHAALFANTLYTRLKQNNIVLKAL